MANEKSLLKEYILQNFVQKDKKFVVDILESSTNKDVTVIKISQCGTNIYVTNGLSNIPMNVKNKSLQYVEFVISSTSEISMETEKNLVEIMVNSLPLKDNSFLHEFHTFSLDYLRNGNKKNIEYDTFLCLRAVNNFYLLRKRISFIYWLPIYKEEAIWIQKWGVFAGSDRSEFYVRATSEFINKYKAIVEEEKQGYIDIKRKSIEKELVKLSNNYGEAYASVVQYGLQLFNNKIVLDNNYDEKGWKTVNVSWNNTLQLHAYIRPITKIFVPNEIDGRRVDVKRSPFFACPAKISKKYIAYTDARLFVKELAFDDDIEKITLTDFPCLEKLSLPKCLKELSLSCCPNLKRTVYKDGIYIEANDNPHAILIGFNNPFEQATEELYIHNDTKIILTSLEKYKHTKNVIIPNNVVHCSYSMWFDLNEFEMEILSLGNKISFINTQELANCRKLKTINYAGTMKEFYSIPTNCNWQKTSVEEINCIDGKINFMIN